MKVTNEAMREHVSKVVGNYSGSQHTAAIGRLNRNLYTHLQWQETTAESGKQILIKILPVMLKLANEYGTENVRMVMNFDS